MAVFGSAGGAAADLWRWKAGERRTVSLHCPALPPAWQELEARPTALDSRSCAFWCFWTAALTFLPTRFCFLQDCVQELFCCFHFTLPIKVLKAGWAAFPCVHSLFSHLAKSFFPNSVTPGKGDGHSGWFPIYRKCGSDFFSLGCWLISDWWPELQSELGLGSDPREQNNIHWTSLGSRSWLTGFKWNSSCWDLTHSIRIQWLLLTRKHSQEKDKFE